MVPTFKEVFYLSQELQLRYIKREDKKLSAANTINRHLKEYKRYFEGTEFESLPINKISVKDIKHHTLQTLENFDLRRRAYNNFITLMRAAFVYALDEEIIKENPMSVINFANPRFINMLAEESDIYDRIYSDEELRKMLLYLRAKERRYPKRVSFMALEYQILMGERRGEVAPSKWSDIKEEDGIYYIEIRRELLDAANTVGNVIVEHTKTSKNRRVPIWYEVREFLDRLIVFHQHNNINSEFLFPSKRSTTGCIDLKTPYRVFYEMCKDLGIKLDKSLPKGTHAYRRNFAKRIGDADLASKLLGNDERVLRKNYYDGVDMRKALQVLSQGHS